MISVPEALGMLAGMLSLVDFFLYYVSILRRKTRPNRATWFILTLVSLIIFSSYYSLGARATAWQPLAYVIGPFITFVLSLKYGQQGWTFFDSLCAGGALFGLFLWWISGVALIALLITVFIDFLGMLPTIKKSYLDPLSEEVLPWFVTCIACVLNLLAITAWRFDIGIYPIYMCAVNGTVLALLFLRRGRLVTSGRGG